MIKKAAKKVTEVYKKQPLLIPLTFFGGYWLYKQIFDKGDQVGPDVIIKEKDLSKGIDHNTLAEELFSSMVGLNFFVHFELWEQLTQLPKGVDVAKVYQLFNEKAQREGYDATDTLTQFINDEWVVPYSAQERAKEGALKRLRALGLN